MKRSIIFLALVTFILSLAACSPQAAPTPTMPMEATMAPMASMENGSMDGMAAAPAVPAGMAYAEGQEIRNPHDRDLFATFRLSEANPIGKMTSADRLSEGFQPSG